MVAIYLFLPGTLEFKTTALNSIRIPKEGCCGTAKIFTKYGSLINADKLNWDFTVF
jgi:hypothetical protein